MAEVIPFDHDPRHRGQDENTLTAGFGAEVAATVAQEAFLSLDAPIHRMAVPDVPTPYNVALLNAVVPQIADIAAKMVELIEF